MTRAGRRLLLVLIVLSLAVGGCGPETVEPEPEPEPEPSRELRVLAVWDGAAVLNPLVNWPEAGVTAGLMYGTLFHLDGDRNLQPYLAEEMTSVGSRVTLKLRPDLMWHDGREVTADDIEFTLHTLLDPEFTGADPGSEFDFIAGARQFRTGAAERIAGIDVQDEWTIRFTVEPGAGLWNLYFLSPVPRHVLGDIPPGELEDAMRRESPIGSGPYRFEDAREVDLGTEIELAWFPEFPLEGGEIERATVLLSPQVPAGEDPDFDVILVSGLLSPPVPEGFSSQKLLAEGFEYLGMNLRDPVLGQAQVRRAIAGAVDRRRVAEDLFGEHAQLVDAPVPWASEEELARHVFNPEAAEIRLTGAGFTRDDDGWMRTPEGEAVRLYLAYPTGDVRRERAAEGIAADLAEIGIRVDPVQIQGDLLLHNLHVRNRFDMYLLAMPWEMSSPRSTWGAGNIWGYEALQSDRRDDWVFAVTEDLPVLFLADPGSILMISSDLAPVASWSIPPLGDLFLWTWTTEAGN